MWLNRVSSLKLCNRHNVQALCQVQAVMHFSSKKKDRAKAFAMKQQRAQSGTEDEDSNKPDFHAILRQLYRRSHPDLLRHSHPALSEHNDTSMQVLNGVLSTIKTTEYPPQIIKDITFYLKATGNDIKEGAEVQPYVLSIRTGGGDCRRQLTASFGQFFIATGLSTDGKFQWNKDYFPLPVENDGNVVSSTSSEDSSSTTIHV